MQVKDMAPNTEYATLAGRLIVTGDTVERGWYDWSERVYDDNTRKSTLVRHIEKGRPARGNDPWGGRGPDIKVRDGIHVRFFDYDENGQRVGTGVEAVIRPEDIGGTWADYMALHGKAVKLKARERRLEAAEPSIRKEIERQLRASGFRIRKDAGSNRYGSPVPDIEISVDTRPVYVDRIVTDHRHEISVTFHGKALERLLQRIGGEA